MPYHFRNLVFEGGGVKGIAYIGAMKIIEDKGILDNILRIGGTSVGAINATLLALGFTNQEQRHILENLDFNKILDRDWGILRNSIRLIREFGVSKGDFLYNWIGKHVKDKLGKRDATFEDLEENGKPKLYVYGTNLSTQFGQVFSIEHSPKMKIIDAVRISMSFPVAYKAVRHEYDDVLVDGGLLNNYPVRLFDREKYISQGNPKMLARTKNYENENITFLKIHPNSSPYVYNKETLGIRLDTKQEIAAFRYGPDQARKRIGNFGDYAKALVSTIMASQGNTYLESDDWHRTIYIDTLGIGTFQLDMTNEQKEALENSGKTGAEKYFDWYDNWSTQGKEKPRNLPGA
ncbi:MAG: patatin-like phospholipase family protein [Dehalococcoidales bacterium]|nr:patatin-like phospholipase family protein [Dehalococcoidales bacterium]